MTLTLAVSPDFSPEKISGWYMFNTWLQRKLGVHIHLDMHDSFAQQRAAVDENLIDLIYANPYDATILVRQKQFTALARPAGLLDEAVVAVRSDSPAMRIEDLPAGTRVASTGDPDVSMMGMILLEPADLSAANTCAEVCSSYILVAKNLMNGTADVGIFPARAYDGLSAMVRASLRPLVRSEISMVQHMLLAGPRAAEILPQLQQAILGMARDEKGAAILKELGIPAWDACTQEDVEFMIDLMDTLIN